MKEEYNNSLEDNAKKANNQLEPFVFDHLVSPLDKEKVNSIPSVVISSNEEFMKFYQTKHYKKELTLVYHGSLIEFQIKIPEKKKIYSVTTDLLCGCVICALSQRPHKYFILYNDGRLNTV